ncbi:MAG: PqqD family protein [Bacteroidaceae bacterium]|nr:PqqD family protein [Bacteroidaceae bacterium]
MRIKKGFELRSICGENIIIASGKENIDFTKIISMNESATYIWQQVLGKEFTVEDMVKCLIAEYDVDEETARKDCAILVENGVSAGFIEL